MKDIRIEIRIKNNALHQAIYSRSKNMAVFCRDNEVTYQYVMSFITLRESPYQSKGMSPTALKLCEILGEDPVTLFPPQLYANTSTKLWVIEKNIEELTKIENGRQLIEYIPEAEIEAQLSRKPIDYALSSLTDREQKVIRLRFGMENDDPLRLEDVGKILRVTHERVRQIEAKAIRKLRQRSRSNKLADSTGYERLNPIAAH